MHEQVAFKLAAVAVAAVEGTRIQSGPKPESAMGVMTRDLLVLHPSGRLALHAGAQQLCTLSVQPPRPLALDAYAALLHSHTGTGAYWVSGPPALLKTSWVACSAWERQGLGASQRAYVDHLSRQMLASYVNISNWHATLQATGHQSPSQISLCSKRPRVAMRLSMVDCVVLLVASTCYAPISLMGMRGCNTTKTLVLNRDCWAAAHNH